MYRTESSPLNGAVLLPVFNETPSEYQYDMQMGNAGTVTLSYTVNQEKSDSPCRTYSYSIRDIRIVNQPYEAFQYEGKTYPKILVVAL